MSGSCFICFESTKNEFTITTPCKHTLCLRCFLKLKKTECPMCRKDFINKLPIMLDNHFDNKKKIENVGLQSYYDLQDNYDFPPLGT